MFFLWLFVLDLLSRQARLERAQAGEIAPATRGGLVYGPPAPFRWPWHDWGRPEWLRAGRQLAVLAVAVALVVWMWPSFTNSVSGIVSEVNGAQR